MSSKAFIEKEVLKKLKKRRSDFPPSLWKNREFALKAVKMDSDALEYVCEEFQNDKQIVREALKHGNFPGCMSGELLHDKKFALSTIKYCADWFYVYPEEIRFDYDVALEAVSHGGSAIQFISDELRNNRDIVWASVKHDGSSLFLHGLEKYLDDHDMCLLAMKTAGMYFEELKQEFRFDREITLTAVSNYHAALPYTSDELKDDKEVVLASVQGEWTHFNFAAASERLRNDKEVVLAAVTHDGYSIADASEEMKKDPEVILAAMKTSPLAFNLLPEELKNDPEVLKTFHECHPENEIVDGVAQHIIYNPNSKKKKKR
ncbi:MAG: DUF4116 domain-containing protein [Bacilli bacterium]|nr:DUF4116 domain-containing protein [Bacilli bacterium]